MQRLLLDDSRTFRDPDYAHRRARTSEQALEILAELHTDNLFLDELWLDHHLGNGPDGTSDTAMPVVDYLARCAATGARFPIGVVVVHTSDPDAAATMINTLRRYGYKTRRVAAKSALTVE